MLFPNILLSQDFSLELKGSFVHVRGLPQLSEDTRQHETFGEIPDVFRRLVVERRALKSRLNHIDRSITELSKSLEPEDL